jgi:anti-sigma factor RsiW
MRTTEKGADPVGNDEHPQLEFGLYVLGALPADEERRLERHLATCAACQAECDDLGEAVVLVSLLSPDDVGSINQLSARPAPQRPRAARHRRAVGRSAGGPGRSAPLMREHGARRRPTRRTRVAVAAAVVMTAIGAGIGFGMWLQSSRDPDILVATVSATATNDATGATAAVEVRPAQDGGYELQAVIVGLPPGGAFQLAATTHDGRTEVILRGVAVGGPQTVMSAIRLSPEEIAFVTVAQMDGAVVVSVQLHVPPPR